MLIDNFDVGVSNMYSNCIYYVLVIHIGEVVLTNGL